MLDPALQIDSVVHKRAEEKQAAELNAAARETELANERATMRAEAVARQAAEDARVRALQRECCTCFDSFLAQEGIECGAAEDQHFTCNDCLDGYVKAESGTEDLDQLAEREGNVFCPYKKHGCADSPAYPDAGVAQHVTMGAFTVYTGGKKKLLEIKLVKEIGDVERAKFEAELKRLSQMDAQQREVHTHGIALEGVVNLKCPKCSAVFNDFGGCCALTCSRAGCGAKFCAWCQVDCGRDAHAHVAQCSEAPRGASPTFPGPGVWERSQRARQSQKAKGYLHAITDAELRNQVALSRITLLTDLGIDINDYLQD
jgi:hypothetical protein